VSLPSRLAVGAAFVFLVAASGQAQQSTAASSIAPATQNAQQIIVPSARATPTVPATGSNSGVQLAIYLCLLVVLLGVGSYFLKNGFKFMPAKTKGARKLNVAETRMLGNRQFLVVAEYEGRKMLLGVCPGRIELLSDLGGKADEPFGKHFSENQ
jgi:flagellar protein FliO/FliZ